MKGSSPGWQHPGGKNPEHWPHQTAYGRGTGKGAWAREERFCDSAQIVDPGLRQHLIHQLWQEAVKLK